MTKAKSNSATTEARERLVEFDRRLKEAARFAPVTAAIVAVNVLVWILSVVSGVDWFAPTGDSLRAWGANYGPLTTHGEGWRLVTCCFLHVGLVQLLVNQWALWQYGGWLERFFGHIGFAMLYLTTGFGSSLMAVRWQPETVLAGSTGPIAGLIGAVGAFYCRAPGIVPIQALNRLRASTFLFLGYNVGVGLYRQRLDAVGFLSGLAAGFVGGLILSQPFGTEARPRRWSRNSVLAAAGLILVILAAYIARPDPSAEFDRIREAQSQAIDAYRTASDDFAHDRIDAKELAGILGTKVVVPWRRAEKLAEELDRRKIGGKAGELVKLTLESIKLRDKGWNLMIDSLATDSAEGMQSAAAQFAEADRLDEEIDAELAAAAKSAQEKLKPK
ncbi:MAG TPA: rhomboid family intramembrane serine protease [Pirellulales bacterium]|nr:rhomboid family intramembrane serine protease [Pirellulales bacterium]